MKMQKVGYTVRMAPELLEMVKSFCKARGIKSSFFVEEALRTKMEDLSDIAEFNKLTYEAKDAIDFKEFLKEID